MDPRPSVDQINYARHLLLDELLGDFPFSDQADRANAVSLFLLPYARDLINGCTPLHMIEAPTPGSGKGLLADVALRLATGRAPAAMVPPEDDDEWRKRLTTQIRLAPTAVLIDNISKVLDSASLASMLTATTWADRLLGTNEIVRVPVRCVWVATSNNPTMSTEIARRCVRIRLTPPTDKPWEREAAEFAHPKLVEWVDEKRDALVWACLTLVQAWIAAGKPSGCVPMGTFEHWASVMGGILGVAGVPGFLENRNEFYEAADTEGATLRQLVAAWHEAFGNREISAATLFPLAKDLDGIDLGDSGSEIAQRTKFGKFLGRQRDRVIGDYRIHAARKVQRTGRYKLLPVRGITDA